MNPNSELDRTRLLKAIKHSTKVLRPFRDLRKRLVTDYVGSQYGYDDNAVRPEIIQNMLALTCEAYVQSLAANRPRVLVTPQHPDHNWFAHTFQLAVNNLIKEIHLEEILRKAVTDAFFSVGIVKVYSADAGMVQLEGEDQWVDIGKPFAENISLDDFVYDTTASEWRKCSFALNKYRISKRKLMEDPAFDRKVVEKLSPAMHSPSNGNENGETPVRELLQSDQVEVGLEPMIDVMDVWLPKDNIVATFPCKHETKPLRVVDFEGTERGPYHLLSLTTEVPDNVMPLSPAMNLKPLNDLINGLLRKQKAQAKRARDIPFFRSGNHEDARRLQKAGDGEWTRLDDPDSVNVMKLGGVDPQNQAFTHSMRDVFSRMAGNLDAMMGLGPQADTLGQDKLIHGAVSKREANMQYRVVDFTRNICADLGWLLWQDEMLEIPAEFETAGVQVKADWTPEVREADYLSYQFAIEPFSMSYKSPSERVQALTNYVMQIAMPMEQLLAQAGGQIDVQELTEVYAELLDMPRLKSIIKFDQPGEERPQAEPSEPEQAQAKPAHTVRETVRRSVPTGGTEQARSNAMQQVLMGADPTPQQAGMLGRERASN